MLDINLVKKYFKESPNTPDDVEISQVFDFDNDNYLIVPDSYYGGMYLLNKSNGDVSGFTPMMNIEQFAKVQKTEPLYSAS